MRFLVFFLSASAYAQPLLGIYYGNQGWKMEQVQAMEAWQGKKHAVVNLFTDWSSTTKIMNNLFGMQLPNIWANGNVPMVTWEPFTGSRTPADIEVRIAAGQYDAYINTWAARMKTFVSGPDGALGNNTPADYVAMWRRVVGIFRALGMGASHVQWVWCVNADDVGGHGAEGFYPGDAYVDWVALDGYNWGASQTWSTWKTPAQTYDSMLARVRALTARPMGLTEFASTSTTTAGANLAAKSQWIGDVFAWATANNIRMVCWFNEDKETNWAIFGGVEGDGDYKVGRTTYRTFAAYRTAVQAGTWATPNAAANPRLLTDSQFAGY